MKVITSLVSSVAAAVVCTGLPATSAFVPSPNTMKKQSPSSSLPSTTSPTLVEEVALQSTFAIAPDDLILRAKEILGPTIGVGTLDHGACLAPNFEFCAPVVGPLPKDEYLGALESFQLTDSFDITQNFFGFVVDPLQTNRVYFFSRQEATHTASFMGAEPTGKVLSLPPQCHHLDFDEEGLVTEFGFYTVDRRQGNTGGLGGAFGYFYGVGRPLPIPECQPYTPSFRFRMLNWIGRLGKIMQKLKE